LIITEQNNCKCYLLIKLLLAPKRFELKVTINRRNLSLLVMQEYNELRSKKIDCELEKAGFYKEEEKEQAFLELNLLADLIVDSFQKEKNDK